MSAGRLWARAALRTRLRPVLVLALLVAIGGGIAMTAISGAFRSQAVVAETFDERRQPDVLSLPNLPGFDWAPIVELPYVESYGLIAATRLCISETGGLGERFGDEPNAQCDQPPAEGGIYRTIGRMDMLRGRRPTGPLEISVNRTAHQQLGWDVGDVFHVEGVRPGRLEENWAGKPRGERPWGPTFRVRVTGVSTGSDDYWRLMSGGKGLPGFAMSPAFIPSFGDRLEYREQAIIRLRGGESDIPRLVADITRITGDPSFPVLSVRAAQRRVERGIDAEAAGLLLFGIALFAAASVLAGQALVRLVQSSAEDATILRALGMDPRAVLATLAAPGLTVGALGAAGAVAVAIAASPRVPIGLARTFEIEHRVEFDVLVLAAGGLAILALTGGASIVTARSAWRSAAGRGRRPPRRRPRSIARLPLKPAAALGMRMALGPRAVAAFPALIGASVGVLAVVAALVVGRGIDESLERPNRAGQTWDAAYFPGDDAAVESDPDIAAAADVEKATVSFGGLPTSAYAVRSLDRPLRQVLVEGRAPRRRDEVAVGPATAAALGAEIGDVVPAGPGGKRSVRIVGKALLWEDPGQAAYDEGVLTTRRGLAHLDPSERAWRLYFADLRPGAEREDVDARLAAAGIERDGYWPAQPPAGLDNLETTRDLPALLAILIALLGAGTVAHSLLVTGHARRRELAILRSLGLSASGARATFAWQATAIGAVALVAGVTLGLLTGHVAWERLATSLPLEHAAPGVAMPVALVFPAALLILNAIAFWPGRAAARESPAAALRAE